MRLNPVEIELLKILRPKLAEAIRHGEPERAAKYAKDLAKLVRKRDHMKRSGGTTQ